jgi:hypothetical protein
MERKWRKCICFCVPLKQFWVNFLVDELLWHCFIDMSGSLLYVDSRHEYMSLSLSVTLKARFNVMWWRESGEKCICFRVPLKQFWVNFLLDELLWHCFIDMCSLLYVDPHSYFIKNVTWVSVLPIMESLLKGAWYLSTTTGQDRNHKKCVIYK